MSQRGLSYYCLYCLIWVLCTMLVGAVAGMLIYPILEWALPVGGTVWKMIGKGLRDGAFYGLVWGPGLGIVMAVRRAYLDRNPETKA